MNPFILPGPQFLAFYAGTALAVIAVLSLWMRFKGGAPDAKLTELTGDPYSIACIREGEREAIRIAIFNLVDRGLLTCKDEYVVAARKDAAQMVRRPLDRAILASCTGNAVAARDILGDSRVGAQAKRYRAEMTNKGLMHPRGFVWLVI